MPPTDRFVITFAAEPPQESLPYGRWADTLREHFLAACREIDTEGEDIGEPGGDRVVPRPLLRRAHLHPRRRAHDRGLRAVRLRVVHRRLGRAGELRGHAPTSPPRLAEANPDWKLDLNDDVIGTWRGEQGKTADMTLVWGVPMIAGGAIVTAELANLAVDQCELVDERFTLIAPDNYRGDYIEVKLWDRPRRGAGGRVAVRRRRRGRGRGRGRGRRLARS